MPVSEAKALRVIDWLRHKLPLPFFLSTLPPTTIYEAAPRFPTDDEIVDVYIWGSASRFVTPGDAVFFYVMYLLGFMLAVCWLYRVAIKWRDDKADL